MFNNIFCSDSITITWRHPQACPVQKKKKLSFGSIMLIILAVLVVLYFVIGIPVMRFIFKKRGVEMIPFVAFWTSIPRLVYEGVKTIYRCTPCGKDSENKEYQPI